MAEFYNNGTDIPPEDAEENSIFIEASTGKLYRLVDGTWTLLENSDGNS